MVCGFHSASDCRLALVAAEGVQPKTCWVVGSRLTRGVGMLLLLFLTHEAPELCLDDAADGTLGDVSGITREEFARG